MNNNQAVMPVDIHPCVSVVIPFYSTLPGLLCKSVRSALDQSFQDIEVIVVDDCSPVAASEELRDIHDTRLIVINHVKNSNGAIARNTGVANARGKYIAFLDYDDLWYPNKIQAQLDLLQKADIEDKTVIYSRCRVIFGDRFYTRPKREIRSDERVGDYLFCAKEIIQTSGIFLTASTAKTVCFHDLKRHQDYQFCLSLEEYGCKFLMSNEPLYDFVQILKVNDYKFSVGWLELYKKNLSYNAIKGFKSLVILRSMLAGNFYKSAIKYSIKNAIVGYFIKYAMFHFFKRIISANILCRLKSIRLGR